jgi:hypothetical protein
MYKHELVGITIQQLIEHFKTSPESFEYYDVDRKPYHSMHPAIYWQPKVQLGDPSSSIVDDPNNGHAICVSWNANAKELTCFLFLKAPPNLMSGNSHQAADGVVTSCRWFERLRGNYRKFKYLRDMIIARDKYRENLIYLKKLSAVFPDTMDTHLFDK